MVRYKEHIEDLFAGLTVVLILFYTIWNVNTIAGVIIWIAVSATPLLFSYVLPYLFSPILGVERAKLCSNDNYIIVIRNFKYSSFLFVLGLVLATSIQKLHNITDVPSNSWRLYAPITIYGVLFIIAFGYLLVSKVDSMTEIVGKFKNSNITDWGQFIDIVEKGGGNVITASGNLLSLSTKRGTELLEGFLRKSSDNKVYLAIPHTMLHSDHIKTIKKNISSILQDRVIFIPHEPFWFIQGIVIVGRTDDSGGQYNMTPLGCFFYKVRSSLSDTMTAGGVFTDLRELQCNNVDSHFRQGILTYNYLLKDLKYICAPYGIEKKIVKAQDKSFEPIKTTVTLLQLE